SRRATHRSAALCDRAKFLPLRPHILATVHVVLADLAGRPHPVLRRPRRRGAHPRHGLCVAPLSLAGRSSYRPIAQGAGRARARARARQRSACPASGSALRDRIRRGHVESCAAVRARPASAPDPPAHGSGASESSGKLNLAPSLQHAASLLSTPPSPPSYSDASSSGSSQRNSDRVRRSDRVSLTRGSMTMSARVAGCPETIPSHYDRHPPCLGKNCKLLICL